MTEREMEDLLATYPEKFFPRRVLTLKGRQIELGGDGRFDLEFEDQLGNSHLMELKAVPAKLEHVEQLTRYKKALEERERRRIFVWLVAPTIPRNLKEFLDDNGIEHAEVHEAEFRQVAEEVGYKFQSEKQEQGPHAPSESKPSIRTTLARARLGSRQISRTSQVVTGPAVSNRASLRWHAQGNHLLLMNPQDLDADRLKALIESFEQAVPSGRNRTLVAGLGTWLLNPASPLMIGTYSSLLRWVATSGWKQAVPAAESIWNYLFGRPAPTWYIWAAGTQRYEFDAEAWRVWYESLPH